MCGSEWPTRDGSLNYDRRVLMVNATVAFDGNGFSHLKTTRENITLLEKCTMSHFQRKTDGHSTENSRREL